MCHPSLSLSAFACARANAFAARCGLSYHDRLDCQQEAFLAVLRCLNKWSPSKGPFTAYCGQAIYRQLRHWYHLRRLVRTGYSRRYLNHPAVVPLSLDVGADPTDESDVEQLADLHRLVHLLPQVDEVNRPLLVRLLAGESLAEQARQLHVTRQAIWQRKQALLAQLRRLMAS